MDIKAVFFDLDGTLVDSARDFIAILQAMRQEQGLPPMEPNLLRQTVSAGAAAMVAKALELSSDSPLLESHKQDFLQRYAEHCAVHTCLFNGVNALLAHLESQQIAWGVVTNKPEHFARPIIEQLDLAARMQVLVCPEHAAAKPEPDMLLLACTQLGIRPAQAIYLGDDRRDIQAAQRAGLHSVAVGYGYHAPSDKPTDWNADFYITHSEQLLSELQPILHSET